MVYKKTHLDFVFLAIFCIFVIFLNGSSTYAVTEFSSERISNKEERTDKIDINSASSLELQKIINVGPVIAERIIEARPYESLDGLQKVKGIGQATLLKIKQQGKAFVFNNGEDISQEKLDEWMPDKNLQRAIREGTDIDDGEITKEKLKKITRFGFAGTCPIYRKGYGSGFKVIKNWTGFEYAENVEMLELLAITDDDIRNLSMPPENVRKNIKSIALCSGAPKNVNYFINYLEKYYPNLETVLMLPTMLSPSYTDEITLTEDTFKEFTIPLSSMLTVLDGDNLDNVNITTFKKTSSDVSPISTVFRVGNFSLIYNVSIVENKSAHFKLLEVKEDLWASDSYESISADTAYPQISGLSKTIPSSANEFYKEISVFLSYEVTTKKGLNYYQQAEPVFRINFE